MSQAYFCLSIDLELLWGRHDLNYQPFIHPSARERPIIVELLKLFKQFEIPATWASVGHLFLANCNPHQGIKHPEITLPNNSFSWFSNDPSTSLNRDPLWYGKDIIRILRDSPGQEIGCHSFSHPDFTDSKMTREWAESELIACLKLAQENKIELKSFVYPRNRIRFTELLFKYGFSAYRGSDPQEPKIPSFLLNIWQLIDLLLCIPHTTHALPEKQILNLPASMYFPSQRGLKKYIPAGLRLKKAIRSIDQAIEKGEIFHMWFHPIDIMSDSDNLLKELKSILEYASNKAASGQLRIRNMSQIAEEMA